MDKKLHYKIWDEIIYSFENSNGYTIRVWEYISNFIPHVTGYIIIIVYPCWLKLLHWDRTVLLFMRLPQTY